MSGKSRRPSPSMVVALIALFVALSGASYAALKKNSVGTKQIAKNGVGASEIAGDAVRAKEIRDGKVGSAELGDDAVTRSELQDGAVGSGEVEDGTLNSGDVQDESLGSTDVQDGSLSGGDVENDGLGSADIAGLAGGDVTPGTFVGGSVTVQFEQATVALANDASSSYDVHCPAGQTALSGGSRGDVTDSEYTITTSSRPIISTANTGGPVDNGTFTGWRATVLNPVNPPGGAFPDPPPGGDILPQVWVICASVP